MEFPKVSVIVPVYNTEQYLRECLESLVKQTYSNYEVIIVNDCSPDNSMSIITEYTTEYPDKFYCITPNVNVGIGRARDLGIHHAKGEYIMFVDSDDFVAPTFIEIPVRTMEQADADIVQFGFEFYAVRPKCLYINRIQKRRGAVGNAESEKQCHYKTYHLKTLQESIRLVDDLVWDKIFRKKIISENGLTFTKRIWEDTLFNHRYMAFAKKLVLITQSLYNYRITPGSLTYNFSPKKLAAMVEINDDIISFFLHNNFDSDYVYNRMKSMWIGLIKRMSGMSRKEREEIFKEYKSEEGPFSRYISPMIVNVVRTSPLYLLYCIRTMGFKPILKSWIKRACYRLRLI